MKTGMYSVYDSKAKAYSHPFHAPNSVVALRIFGDAVADPATQLNRHPEDYVLYEIARFDDETAEIEKINLTAVATALQVKESSNG